MPQAIHRRVVFGDGNGRGAMQASFDATQQEMEMFTVRRYTGILFISALLAGTLVD
jgi:hypothetical protein